MPVTQDEHQRYFDFVRGIARRLGTVDYSSDEIVYHYTDGPGFLGILQSGSIFATQVASLNDKSETKYATDLFKASISKVLEKQTDGVSRAFLSRVLEFVRDDPQYPYHAVSKFFVTCFSARPDDWAQWRCYGGGGGNPNGYAIGFRAGELNRKPSSSLFRVQYDRGALEKASDEVAEVTLRFFIEGLTPDRRQDISNWGDEFFEAWDSWIYKLAPLAKHSTWQSEKEFRLVHELEIGEKNRVCFVQRESMLARYLPLTWPATPGKLPIARIMIGPGNHPAFTAVSVRLLLDQLGYSNILVECSQIPFQKT